MEYLRLYISVASCGVSESVRIKEQQFSSSSFGHDKAEVQTLGARTKEERAASYTHFTTSPSRSSTQYARNRRCASWQTPQVHLISVQESQNQRTRVPRSLAKSSCAKPTRSNEEAWCGAIHPVPLHGSHTQSAEADGPSKERKPKLRAQV